MTRFNFGGIIPGRGTHLIHGEIADGVTPPRTTLDAGPAHTPAGIIAFERYVTAEQVRRFGEEFRRLACLHDASVPVESVVDGAVLAWLCPGCDTQLDKDWKGTR